MKLENWQIEEIWKEWQRFIRSDYHPGGFQQKVSYKINDINEEKKEEKIKEFAEKYKISDENIRKIIKIRDKTSLVEMILF